MQLRKIGNYTVIELLGKGSFGKVYLVESEDTKHYALKSIEDTKEIIELAQQQVSIYSALDHPNIVKLHQSFPYENKTCLAIVLEYCPDGDLRKLIKDKRLSEDEYKTIIKQIVEALVYLHDKKIVHRDIKPENVMMKQGVPKIADFGSSKIVISTGAKTREGTQFYMAPEIFEGSKYDGRVDVWSLGILTYELLTGKRIFEVVQGLRPPAQRKDFPSESMFNEIKSERMRELVRLMLKKNPQERLTSRQVFVVLNGMSKDKSQINKPQIMNSQKPTQKNQPTKNQIVRQTINWKFSEQHKGKLIKLTKKNSTATHPDQNGSPELALVEGVVLKKGSSIRFKIQSIGLYVYVGLGIRNVIAANSYQLKNYKEIGHGCFLLSCTGLSFSHSNKEHNNVETGFKSPSGNVIEVETNEDELRFRNETRKWEFKMKMRLTEEEWQQACFCVKLMGKRDLRGSGDSVSILDSENKDGCMIQ